PVDTRRHLESGSAAFNRTVQDMCGAGHESSDRRTTLSCERTAPTEAAHGPARPPRQEEAAMSVFRYEPFRDPLERLISMAATGTRAPLAMPMDVYRAED